MLSPFAYNCVLQMMQTDLFSSEADMFEVAVLKLFEEFRRGEVMKATEGRLERFVLEDEPREGRD